MRLGHLVFAVLLAAGAGLAALGADVVLKDGQSIPTSKPYVVKGRMALLTRPDGTLVSIPVDEIDLARTAAAARAPAPPPAPAEAAPGVAKPLTLAEAAKIKGPRKATVVFTDRDMSQGDVQDEGEKAEKGEKEGEVSISGFNATRTKTGYSIEGSVINSGKGDVRGVSVTIEMIGEGGKSVQSVYGNLAKDSLAPGEKSAFSATVPTEAEARSWKYAASWPVTVPIKPADPAVVAKAGEVPPKAAPPPEEVAKPAAKPEPPTIEIRSVPRGDVAPPTANAPIGAPTTPGGAYLPRPSDSQAAAPKTP